MARRLRVEMEGGLYHLIARGNDRQDIFYSPEDHQKFPALLIKEKARSQFFLYAFCLMTNHLHPLLEGPHTSGIYVIHSTNRNHES